MKVEAKGSTSISNKKQEKIPVITELCVKQLDQECESRYLSCQPAFLLFSLSVVKVSGLPLPLGVGVVSDTVVGSRCTSVLHDILLLPYSVSVHIAPNAGCYL